MPTAHGTTVGWESYTWEMFCKWHPLCIPTEKFCNLNHVLVLYLEKCINGKVLQR